MAPSTGTILNLLFNALPRTGAPLFTFPSHDRQKCLFSFSILKKQSLRPRASGFLSSSRKGKAHPSACHRSGSTSPTKLRLQFAQYLEVFPVFIQPVPTIYFFGFRISIFEFPVNPA
jgi:hypothetical protein